MKKFRFTLAFIFATLFIALAAHTNVKHNYSGMIVFILFVIAGCCVAYFIPKTENRRLVFNSVAVVMWIFTAIYTYTIRVIKSHVLVPNDYTSSVRYEYTQIPVYLNYAISCALLGIMLLIIGMIIKKKNIDLITFLE